MLPRKLVLSFCENCKISINHEVDVMEQNISHMRDTNGEFGSADIPQLTTNCEEACTCQPRNPLSRSFLSCCPVPRSLVQFRYYKAMFMKSNGRCCYLVAVRVFSALSRLLYFCEIMSCALRKYSRAKIGCTKGGSKSNKDSLPAERNGGGATWQT